MSSTTQLTCKFANIIGLEPNTPYKIEVRIKNIGFALQEKNFEINFLPVITAITPNIGKLSYNLKKVKAQKWFFLQGSISGGTQIKILGYGFIQRTTYIQIGSSNYYDGDSFGTKISYYSILLTTNAELNGDYEILIYSNGILAVCGISSCSFSFSIVITPTINSILPKIINDSSLITLTGSSFGNNITRINVKIGSQICRPITIDDQSISCQLDGLNLGNQIVKLNIDGINHLLFCLKT